MSMPRRTLAEQIADLDDPTPKDVDPESFGGAFERAAYGQSDSASSSDVDDGRSHYETVEKSKLRQPGRLKLGKEYNGVEISRDQLQNGIGDADDSSDDPFASKQDTREISGFGDESESEEKFADQDRMDLNTQMGADEETDGNETSGEGDEEKFNNYVSRDRKTRASTGRKGQREINMDNKSDDSDRSKEAAGEDDGDAFTSDESGESGDQIGQIDYSAEDSMSNEAFLSGASDDESGTEASQPAGAATERAVLRDLMREGQRSMVSQVAEGMKADVLKGGAVKRQRAAFDSLLNTRIGLQKALVSTNSLAYEDTLAPNLPSDQQIIEAAETAAINLFNSLSALRESLSSATKSTKKRPFSATLDSSTGELKDQLQSLDKASMFRSRPILNKWSAKTQSVATIAAAQNNFSATPTQTQTLTSVLDIHLSGSDFERHIARTHTPRNCAPLQSKAGVEEEEAIYDDTDWYSLLLQDLVNSKMLASGNSAAVATSSLNGPTAQSISALRRENKQHRKGVDVRASKGRKMRFTVIEKLQNFMAPEDRGTWGQQQADELFAGLLGRKVKGGLREEVEEGEDDAAAEVAGLRLFSGS